VIEYQMGDLTIRL